MARAVVGARVRWCRRPPRCDRPPRPPGRMPHVAVKTWRTLALDDRGDLVEYVVAVSRRSQARQALLRHGGRPDGADLTTTDDVPPALADPARVYRRAVVGGSAWTPS